MSEWQPIETAPKDGTVILIYGHLIEDVQQVSAAFWQASDPEFPWWFLEPEVSDDPAFSINGVAADDRVGPTKWRPMPAQPEASDA